MKVGFVPLDERPCNWKYVELMTRAQPQLNLTVCPLNIMGKRKMPAQREALRRFLADQAEHADALVIALDTLFYGGLIPSRTHHLSDTVIDDQVCFLRDLKQKHPQMKIYASLTVMRSPAYNSGFEEPDYYEDYGRALHRRAYLQDKQNRALLTDEEAAELAEIVIPVNVVNDYENRRAFNETVSTKVLALVNDGVIDFLVVPQDDSAPYGYTASAQVKLHRAISTAKLTSRVTSYPGADEVGSTLLARAYTDYFELVPKIYAFFASTLGPTIVPIWEDRPMFETLKAHVMACGAELVDNVANADFALAVNSAGKVPQRAAQQLTGMDITYQTYRNLPAFVQKIQRLMARDVPVAVCDSAFGNGGDLALIQQLDAAGDLGRLLAYAGWNTNANTLGTVLADAVIGLARRDAKQTHLTYRLIEDVLYQSIVRQSVAQQAVVQDADADHLTTVATPIIADELNLAYTEWQYAQDHPLTINAVTLPWQRLFEVNFELQFKEENSNESV